MNMWAGYPDFLDFLAEDFKNFLENVEEVDLKSKYLLPNIVDRPVSYTHLTLPTTERV